MKHAYEQLEAQFERLSHIKAVTAILHWDNAVVMPSGAAAQRAGQLATLSEVSHDMLTDPLVADLIAEAEEDAHLLSDWQQANLREMYQQWKHTVAVDKELTSEMARAAAESEHVWREARKENDFARFAPFLEHILKLVREIAAAKSNAFGCLPYDALLDSYDPGLTMQDIDPLFVELAQFLPGFTQQVIEHQSRLPKPVPIPPVPVDKQQQLGERFLTTLGFDLHHGRLDTSTHPFCGGFPGDIRLTTRYKEDRMLEGFFGVLHECGHALYEQQLPMEWRTQPVGEARGMSMHESQSLFVEMQLGRSLDFLVHAAPLMQQMLGEKGKAWEPENIFRQMTQVEPGLIRVNADEVTYPCHVMLRYQLEKELLGGNLKVNDLPGAWNEGMMRLLSVAPMRNAEGCMQDIHWSEGSFGYFPTYTLGALIAAQLFAALAKAVPDVHEQIRQGNFAVVMNWLKQNVHAHGSKLSTPELIEQATGTPLSAAAFKSHLFNRYMS